MEKGVKQPLLLTTERSEIISEDKEHDEEDDGDAEYDESEEALEESHKPATSIASAYNLLTPSVKVCFNIATNSNWTFAKWYTYMLKRCTYSDSTSIDNINFFFTKICTYKIICIPFATIVVPALSCMVSLTLLLNIDQSKWSMSSFFGLVMSGHFLVQIFKFCYR